MDPQAAFCSACGYAASDGEASVKKSKEVISQILARSSSCKNKLDEWQKNFLKIINSMMIGASAPALIYFVVCFFMYANGNERDIPEIPVWLYIVYFAFIIFVVYFCYRKLTSIREEYSRYNGYCETEKLLVDTQKIYGANTKGQLTLKYNQINKVTLKKTDMTAQLEGGIFGVLIFPNDMLEITDTANNHYKFYSFTNCQELRAAIEAQMRAEAY